MYRRPEPKVVSPPSNKTGTPIKPQKVDGTRIPASMNYHERPELKLSVSCRVLSSPPELAAPLFATPLHPTSMAKNFHDQRPGCFQAHTAHGHAKTAYCHPQAVCQHASSRTSYAGYVCILWQIGPQHSGLPDPTNRKEQRHCRVQRSSS